MMRQSFIVLVFFTLILLTAQKAPVTQKSTKRDHQSQDTIVQGDVARSINATNTAIKSALDSSSRAASQSSKEVIEATALIYSAKNASAAIDVSQKFISATQGPYGTIWLCLYFQSLQQYQQASIASAMQTSIAIDTLVTQAAAALNAQTNAGSAAGPSSALTAATVLVQQLYFAHQQQLVLATNISHNASAYFQDKNSLYATFVQMPLHAEAAFVGQQSANLYGETGYVTYDLSSTKDAVQKAYNDSLIASSTSPSIAATKQALSSVSLALTAVTQLAADITTSIYNFENAGNSYEQYFYDAYNFYTGNQTVLASALLNQTTAVNNLLKQSQAFNTSLTMSEGQLRNASKSVSSAFLKAQNSLYTTYFFYKQSQIKCARANTTSQAEVRAQVRSCKPLADNATAHQRNRAMAACNSANYKTTKASQDQVLLCGNLSSTASVSKAVNLTVAALGASQSSIRGAVQKSAVAMSKISYEAFKNVSNQSNILANPTQTQQIYAQSNIIVAANYNVSNAIMTQASASTMVSIYDSLFGQALAAQAAQHAATTPATWQAASILTLQLQYAYESLFQQAGTLQANATRKSFATPKAASSNLTATSQSQIVTSQNNLFSTQYNLFSYNFHTAIQTAYSDSLLATSPSTGQTAMNSIDAAVKTVLVFANSAESLLAQAVSDLAQANGALSLLAANFKVLQTTFLNNALDAQKAGYASINAIQSITSKVGNMSLTAQAMIKQATASSSAIDNAKSLIDTQVKTTISYCVSSSEKTAQAISVRKQACSAAAGTPKSQNAKSVKCIASKLQVKLAEASQHLACAY